MNNQYIDTTSYTNKDFRSIWPELLELVTDLTDKWDPNNSNEADPGVALLKLQAFVADKLNYNIDKNTLEAFPSSVTQRGNAQKLYDSLGYELKWYKSAKTGVHFKFVNPIDDSEIKKDTGIVTFNIPVFTQISDSENKVIYTTLESAVLDTDNNTQTEFEIDAIEGPIESFLINGSDKITINNLDADYRLYFTEPMIASNGIFINNIGLNDFWEPAFNLESTNAGRKVFKFGVLPTTNQCYIQFPQDAAELFGQGINIHYVISSGSNGNIRAKFLTNFAQEYPDNGKDDLDNSYSLNKYIKVINLNGTTSGQDPETLESAYKNYQRTVNTFSTLVTLQDYFNAIYNSEKVSNVIVTDRLTDFNASYKVKNRSSLGVKDELFARNKEHGLSMNAFNLAIYPLNNVANVYDAQTYAKTFKTSAEAQRYAENVVEDSKSVQHDWAPINSSVLSAFLFKNMISISGQVITYQKVSTSEAKQIIDKIKSKLYETYQSRNIEFGKDLEVDDIIETIKNADSRVKDFIIDDPTYYTDVMYADNSQLNLMRSYSDPISNITLEDLQIEIIARSILAGVTPLFLFDTDTIYSYTMKPVGSYLLMDPTSYESELEKYEASVSDEPNKEELINSWKAACIRYDENSEALMLNPNPEPNINDQVKESYKDISAITSQVDIPFKPEGYKLKTNETVFMYAPSYISKAQISTYLNVCIKDTTGTLATIPANSLYQLKPDQTLYVSESVITDDDDPFATNNKYLPTDSDEVEKEITSKGKFHRVYEAGTIIKPSFKMIKDTKGGINDGDSDRLKYYINLESDKTIDIMEANTTKINKKSSDPADVATKQVYCAWITDDLNNKLFNLADENAAKEFVKAEQDKLDADETYIVKPAYIEHILQQNELFMYTDSTKSDLIILQSGTRLKIPYSLSSFNSEYWTMDKPSQSEINQNGLDALNNYWREIPRNLTYFEVEELEIQTLGTGVTIYNTSENNPDFISNNAKQIKDPDSIKWVYDDQKYELPQILIDGNSGWKAFSRLSIFSSPETVCTLGEHQSLCLFERNETYDNYSEKTKYSYSPIKVMGPGQSFTSNYVAILSGGIKQDVRVLKEDDISEAIIISPFNYVEVTDNQDKQQLWDSIEIGDTLINAENENSYLGDGSISVTVNSDDSTQTKLKFSGESFDDNNTIKLKTKFSGLFNGSYANNTGTIIPIIISGPGKIEASFNAPIIATKDKRTIDNKFKVEAYNDSLICLDYVGLNKLGDPDYFEITLNNVDKGDSILITMYKPQHYIDYNNHLSDTYYQVKYYVATVDRRDKAGNIKDTVTPSSTANIGHPDYWKPCFDSSTKQLQITDWDNNQYGYRKYEAVRFNNRYYVKKTDLIETDPDTKGILIKPSSDNINWKKVDVQEAVSGATFDQFDLVYYADDFSDLLEKIKERVIEMGQKTITIQQESGLDASYELNKFDFTYLEDEEDQILDPLNPKNFYKENHVCNKFLISQINSLDIRLARQSKQ